MRLSVGDLESLRYWKDREDQDLPALLAKLRRTEPPSRQMEAGKALAKFFENATAKDFGGAISEGWEFEFRCDVDFKLPAIRELKLEETFATPYGDVNLVGVVDGLDGLTVSDQKLTERFDAEKYTESLQWRAYLAMTGAEKFVYDIFVGKYMDDQRVYRGFKGHDYDGDAPPPSDPTKYVTIYEYHQIPFYTYPDIRKDVSRAVTELAEIVAMHLPEKAA